MIHTITYYLDNDSLTDRKINIRVREGELLFPDDVLREIALSRAIPANEGEDWQILRKNGPLMNSQNVFEPIVNGDRLHLKRKRKSDPVGKSRFTLLAIVSGIFGVLLALISIIGCISYVRSNYW